MTTKRREPKTEVQKWVVQMGYHLHQFADAAARIGMTSSQLKKRSIGIVPLSQADRMAMSAALLGIAPWTPAFLPKQEITELAQRQREDAEQ